MPDRSAPDPAAGVPIDCPTCHTSLPPDATFCLQCGTRLPPRTAAPAIAPPSVPVAPPVVPSVSPPLRPTAATMMGVSPRDLLAQTVLDTSPPAAMPPGLLEPTQAPGAQPLRVPNAHRTMMGVAAEELRAARSAGDRTVPAPPDAPPVPRGGTMHGAAVVPGAPTLGPGAARAVPPAPATGRTMLGVAAGPSPLPPSPGSYGAPGALGAPPASFGPPSNTTSQRLRRERAPMIGGASPGVPVSTVPPGKIDPRAPTTPPYGPSPVDSLDARIPGMPRRGRAGAGLAIGFLILAACLGAAGLLYGLRWRTEGVSPLAAQIRQGAQGTEVTFNLPDVPPGTHVRYHGADYPVGTSGAVVLPAGVLPSEVGTVGLPVEIVRPGAAPEHRTAEVLIAWRVEPDLRRLGDDPAVIHLVFHVPSGSTLAVSGHPITVAGDMGIAEIRAPEPSVSPPSPPSPGDAWTSRFPIRVQTATGSIAQGEYELRVPRATLRIDAPGPATAVTTDALTLRGRAPGATRVTVAGHPAGLSNGTFTADIHVAPGFTAVPVLAWAPGAVPARAVVNVYRDMSPQAYLGAAPQGPSAVAAQSPTEGVKVRLSGRVLGNPVAGSDGPTFQLLVEDRACRSGRCLVWVNPSTAADVHDGDRVEVVGETHGTRAYTTLGGERRSDPVVVGLYILPVRR